MEDVMSTSAAAEKSCTTKTGANKLTLWIVGGLIAILAIFGISYYKKPEPIHKATDKCVDTIRKMGPRPEDKPAHKGIFWTAMVGGLIALGAAIHYVCRPESWRKLRGKKQPVAEPTK